jgi:hypothetical protein
VSQGIKAALIAAAAVVALAAAGPASAAPSWAPASSATIHPGVQTITDGGQCTSNFVFYDASNTSTSARPRTASGTDGNTATNGCDAGSLPVGTPVEVDGASRPGDHGLQLVDHHAAARGGGPRHLPVQRPSRSSGSTRRTSPEVNPSIPFWGGPTGLASSVADQSKVLSYGNSSLRAGITQLSPKEGVKLLTDGNGWSHDVLTGQPWHPGDSGSAFIDKTGKAFGVLSTLQLAPAAGSNGVGEPQPRARLPRRARPR